MTVKNGNLLDTKSRRNSTKLKFLPFTFPLSIGYFLGAMKYQVLDEWKVWVSALVLTTPIAVFLWRVMRRSRMDINSRNASLYFFMPVFVIPFIFSGLLLIANGALDFGTATEVITPILSKSEHHSHRTGYNRYVIRIGSWRDNREFEDIEISDRNAFESIGPSDSKVKIGVKPGFLGLAWVHYVRQREG